MSGWSQMESEGGRGEKQKEEEMMKEGGEVIP